MLSKRSLRESCKSPLNLGIFFRFLCVFFFLHLNKSHKTIPHVPYIFSIFYPQRRRVMTHWPRRGKQSGRQQWKNSLATPLSSRHGHIFLFFLSFNVLPNVLMLKFKANYINTSKYKILTSPDEEVLSYLSMFTEPASAGTVGLSAHPVDLVMQSFQRAEDVPRLLEKCQGFLEEAMKIHGKKMEIANIPDIWSVSLCIFYITLLVLLKKITVVPTFLLQFAELDFLRTSPLCFWGQMMNSTWWPLSPSPALKWSVHQTVCHR